MKSPKRCTATSTTFFFEISRISLDKRKYYNFHGFFMAFTIKIEFSLISTIIFVSSTSKCVRIQSFDKIGGFSFSELHSKRIKTVCISLEHVFWNFKFPIFIMHDKFT